MKLPPFNPEGVLPPGDYQLTLPELRQSYLVTGEGVNSQTWDHMWRLKLVNNLEILSTELWAVGIENIFIDGSFVEFKDHPNDIDGYFEVDFKYFVCGKLHKDLNLLNREQIWTWDPETQRAASNFAKRQLPMWFAYRIELYPHYDQLSGITDEFGQPLLFPAAFRQTRSSRTQKGIVQLKKEAVA